MVNQYIFNLEQGYLSHHGVKGQKWGVRNGPPYPIEDKTLAAGTVRNTVAFIGPSSNKKSKHNWTYTFSNDDVWDKKVYEGPFAYGRFASNPSTMAAFNRSLKITRDLKLADSSDRIKGFEEIYNKNKKLAVKELTKRKNLLNSLEDRGIDIGEKNRKAASVDVKNLTDENKKDMYALFMNAMENAEDYKITQKYQSLMEKNFDGMVDDNNVNVYNKAHDPLILFDPKVYEIFDSKFVSGKEINDALDYVYKENKKHGRNTQI